MCLLVVERPILSILQTVSVRESGRCITDMTKDQPCLKLVADSSKNNNIAFVNLFLSSSSDTLGPDAFNGGCCRERRRTRSHLGSTSTTDSKSIVFVCFCNYLLLNLCFFINRYSLSYSFRF
jgi:hypothetical protein